MNRSMSQKGFTLLEIVVTIGIMGVLLAISTMSISDYGRRAALKNATRTIEADLTNARTAARVRQQRVRVDFTAAGYTAYVDNNADNAFNAGDNMVLTGIISGDIQLLGVAPFVVPPAGNITFDTSGMNIVPPPPLPGGLPGTTMMTLNRTGDATRAYRITILQRGIIQVERSETGMLGPWARAW